MALSQKTAVAQTTFFELAAKEYERAISLHPTNALYHLSLAWVYLNLSERNPDMQASARWELTVATAMAPMNQEIQAYVNHLYEAGLLSQQGTEFTRQ